MMPSDWPNNMDHNGVSEKPVSREDLLSVPNRLIGSFDLTTEVFCEALYEQGLHRILSRAIVNTRRGKKLGGIG